MDTNEVIKKHEKAFSRTRVMMKILLMLVLGMIIFVQRENIARLFHWLNN